MNKLPLIILFSLFFLTTQAQVRLSIVPKAGISIANVSYDEDKVEELSAGTIQATDIGESKSRTGFLAGVGFEIGLTDNFSFQPELLFIQKGARGESDIPLASLEAEALINYLEIPLLAKIKFGSEIVQGYVNAGPSIAFGLSGKAKLEASAIGFSVLDEEADIEFGDNENEIKQTDFGLQFGAGVAFDVGSGQLLLDFRYGLGLTEISNDIPLIGNLEVKNRAIQISLGYSIPLGN